MNPPQKTFPEVLYLPLEDVERQRENYSRQISIKVRRLRILEMDIKALVDHVEYLDERIESMKLKNQKWRQYECSPTQEAVEFTKPMNSQYN